MRSAREDVVKKTYELLRGLASSKVGIGAFAFVLAYTTSGDVNCPFCGSQGLHPWEWGVVLGI